MARYADIDKCEIVNGKYVGVSVYFQGCEFHCEGCFNPSTWNFNDGDEWNEDVQNKVLELCDREYIHRLSILGGEPAHPLNNETVVNLMKAFKERFPKKKIWMWTGYLFENIPNKELLQYADYIVDGQFQLDKKDLRLKFRGSSNQRIWEKRNGEWYI